MALEDFINDTHNQHFVARTEQRLNSCSDDPSSKKARIYCFNVIDADAHEVQFQGKKTIENNLSFRDLFTLSRLTEKERVNLENLFKRYESVYSEHVANVLGWVAKAREVFSNECQSISFEKIEGCNASELISSIKLIYTYNVMNWLRNPYKVKEVLRSFGEQSHMCVAQPDALELYFSLINKNVSEEEYICSTYKLSAEEYRAWMRVIILFLYSQNGGATILDGFVEEFFLADEYTTAVLVQAYDEKCALLSDIGLVRDSRGVDLIRYMNISKNCIVALQHTAIEDSRLEELLDAGAVPAEHRGAAREQLKSALGRKVFGTISLNNAEVLAGYNKICVKAAAFKVFSASTEVDGVKVIPKSTSKALDQDTVKASL